MYTHIPTYVYTHLRIAALLSSQLPLISKAPKGNGIGATGSKNPRAC